MQADNFEMYVFASFFSADGPDKWMNASGYLQLTNIHYCPKYI